MKSKTAQKFTCLLIENIQLLNIAFYLKTKCKVFPALSLLCRKSSHRKSSSKWPIMCRVRR